VLLYTRMPLTVVRSAELGDFLSRLRTTGDDVITGNISKLQGTRR